MIAGAQAILLKFSKNSKEKSLITSLWSVGLRQISQILDKIKIEKIAQIGNYCQLKHQRCASFKLAIDTPLGVRPSS